MVFCNNMPNVIKDLKSKGSLNMKENMEVKNYKLGMTIIQKANPLY